MDKNIVYRIQDYLKNNHIADLTDKKSKMTLRAEGKLFTMQEHMEGMILALISGQNKWYRVERQLGSIKKLFFDYQPDKILQHDGDYYFRGLQRLGANGRFAERQMDEVPHNVKVLQTIEADYGTVDAFLTKRPVYEVVKMLSTPGSKYKLNQMSIALVCEYLRNVGVDTAKPDEHMRRMLGSERLGVSKQRIASEIEVIQEFYRLSKETGMWAADIDYLFWCYCADGKAEICGANPKCEKCVIKEFCNRNISKSDGLQPADLHPKAPFNTKRVNAPSTKLSEYRIRVADVIDNYVKTYGYGKVKDRREIEKMLEEKLGELNVMFQASDMCYNKTNKANLGSYSTDVLLFEASEKKGFYRILGRNFPYTGDVVWTKNNGQNEVVGHWENGKLSYWGDTLI